MNLIDSHERILRDSLEKIIFNDEDFKILKETINDLSVGRIETKRLREKIIKCRIQMLEELVEFFPFYLNQELKRHTIEKFSEDRDILNLEEKLKERNLFLEEIGHKINNLFKKLKKKVER